jgi:hypothetical protein
VVCCLTVPDTVHSICRLLIPCEPYREIIEEEDKAEAAARKQDHDEKGTFLT